jgi:hypothetical protein
MLQEQRSTTNRSDLTPRKYDEQVNSYRNMIKGEQIIYSK